MLRDMRHDNLNAFIGACTEPPNICIITEYCTRGSLKVCCGCIVFKLLFVFNDKILFQDVLENEDVKLDNMFTASLVADILRGMIYLHDSPLRFHGSLRTSNCLIDSRWVVKLSDFGLFSFKQGSDDIRDEKEKADINCQSMFDLNICFLIKYCALQNCYTAHRNCFELDRFPVFLVHKKEMSIHLV